MSSPSSPPPYSGDADGGCQCQLASLASISKEDGITVLGITADTPFVMGPWSDFSGITCLSDTSLATCEKYVGTLDFGKFLDDLDVSTDMAGYKSCKRGCVVLDEDQKVVYAWTGMPDQLPDHRDPGGARHRQDQLRVKTTIRAAIGARERGEAHFVR